MIKLMRTGFYMTLDKAGFYSILVDETKDLSKQEESSIVIHYQDDDTSVIKKRFLTFEPVQLRS